MKKYALIVFLIFLVAPTISSIDITKLNFSYDNKNCINIFGLKKNFCLENTSITIIFPNRRYEGSPCKMISAQLSIEDINCFQFSDFEESYLDDNTVSCSKSLKNIFDKTCQPGYADNYLSKIGTGMNKKWTLSIYDLANNKITQHEFYVLSEDQFKSQKDSLYLKIIGIFIGLILTIFSFIPCSKRKKSKTIELILGIILIAINLILLAI